MGSNERSEEHSLMIEGGQVESAQIDPKRSRFPYCIVWSPLPVISWFCPCIGHIGICREDGVILDFAGPNFVCVDNFTFGEPTRYLQLTREQCCAFLDSAAADEQDSEPTQNGEMGSIVRWDDALRKATQEYQHRTYNILTCNCHSFVSNCLNRLKFQARDWNVVNLAVLMLVRGRFVSKLAIAKTFVPFVVVFLVGLALGGDTFLAYLAVLVFALVGWFLIGSYCFKKLIHV